MDSITLKVACTEEEWAKLRAIADSKGKKITGLLNTCINKVCRDETISDMVERDKKAKRSLRIQETNYHKLYNAASKRGMTMAEYVKYQIILPIIYDTNP